MALIEDQEVIIQIDKDRSVTIIPSDAGSLVLTVEGMNDVAIVEMQKPDVVALYEALEDWIKQ
jgi:hypothetical protein